MPKPSGPGLLRSSLGRAVAAAALLLVVSPTLAAVTLSVDTDSLNEMLRELTAHEIDVPITEERSLRVLLQDLKVLGLDPAGGGEGGNGEILTSLQLVVPELGLTLPVKPRISPHVVQIDGRSQLELRFAQVALQLPLGSIDLAGFIDPVRFPAENFWVLDGAQSEVQVRSRLDRIRMGRESILFEFDLEVIEP